MKRREDKTLLSPERRTTPDRPAMGALAPKVSDAWLSDDPGSPTGDDKGESDSIRISRVATMQTFLTTDKFVERELIGYGGMSVVIRAFDKELGRDVAIKLLTHEASTNEEDIARLVEEARITGSLEHPHIVPVYELGMDDRGVRFLCMKLVKGETLEDTLSWAGASRLEGDCLSNLLQVFAKVCDAVSFAHSRGVLHRDLKPSNVMVGDFGEVYVMDWGVARCARRGTNPDDAADEFAIPDPLGAIVGTPRYMAPEQLRGLHDQMDERTDVFGLGAMLYQILTGEPPHDGLGEVLEHRGRISIPPPCDIATDAAVPPGLSRIALKAMAEEPADRYPSVDELRRDIERFQRTLGMRCQGQRPRRPREVPGGGGGSAAKSSKRRPT